MGRRLSDPVRTYTWNLASTLESYADSGGTATCSYDAYGLRTQRIQGGVTRGFAINYALGAPSVCTVTDGASALRHYVYLPNGMLLHSIEETDEVRRFHHYDEMGNTVFLSDDTRNLTDTYAVTPFGRIVSQTGTTENPFVFGGLYGAMHEGEGLYYVRARYYDANTGRFVSRDPVKGVSPQGVNPYQFAFNNPKLYIDPAGRDVRISGYGRFGLSYNEGFQYPKAGSASGVTSRLRIQFDMSVETDGGIRFSRRVRLRDDDNSSGPAKPLSGARISVSHEGFSIDVGNIIGSFEKDSEGWSLAKFAPSIGSFGSFLSGSQFGVSPAGPTGINVGGGEEFGLRLGYSFGDFTVQISPTLGDPASHLDSIPGGPNLFKNGFEAEDSSAWGSSPVSLGYGLRLQLPINNGSVLGVALQF